MLSEKQKAILKATLATVEREGVTGFTMKKVASEIGVTDASLYKHFQDKTQIFAALAELFREETLESLVRIANTEGVSSLEKLETFVMERARQFQSEPALTAVLFSEELFRSEPQVAAINLDTLERHAQILLSLISAAQRNGQLRSDIPAEHILVLLTGPIRLLVGKWKAGESEVSLEQSISIFWQTFLKLLKSS
ncbi:MAG: TetR/AcrR family transcriptional regulator [Spirochaetales bacterium]|nr:TetR/AcrR family transcriptional regulator [Spirochaetales bacterium]